MTTVLIFAFALSVLYAVLGNVVVYFILLRRGVPVRFLWSGTPGYLYRVCARATPSVSDRLRRFSYSTNVALLAAAILAFYVAGVIHQQ